MKNVGPDRVGERGPGGELRGSQVVTPQIGAVNLRILAQPCKTEVTDSLAALTEPATNTAEKSTPVVKLSLFRQETHKPTQPPV